MKTCIPPRMRKKEKKLSQNFFLHLEDFLYKVIAQQFKTTWLKGIQVGKENYILKVKKHFVINRPLFTQIQGHMPKGSKAEIRCWYAFTFFTFLVTSMNYKIYFLKEVLQIPSLFIFLSTEPSIFTFTTYFLL